MLELLALVGDRTDLGLLVFEAECTRDWPAVTESAPSDLCLTVEEIETKYNVTLHRDAAEATLEIEAGMVPKLARLKREKAWQLLGYQGSPEDDLRPVAPLRVFGSPQVGLSQTYRTGTDRPGTGWHSGWAVSEAAWGTLRANWSANTSEDLTGLRATWSRTEGLPLGISSAQLGDVNIPGDQILDYRRGRGAVVSTMPRGRTSRSFSTVIEGALPSPSWSAELYVNGQLLDYQPPGVEPSYRFEGVPVSGTTNINVKMYGPAGEELGRDYTVRQGQHHLAPGRLGLTIATLEEDQDLIPVDETETAQRGERVARVSAGYGVSPSTTVTVSATSLAAGNYLGAGGHSSLFGAPVSVEAVRDPNGRLASLLSAGLGRLHLQHQERQETFLAEQDPGATRITGARYSDNVLGGYASGEIERLERGGFGTQYRADARWSRPLLPGASGTVRATRTWRDDPSSNIQVTARYRRDTFTITGSTNATVEPVLDLSALSANARYAFDGWALRGDASYGHQEHVGRFAPGFDVDNANGWRVGVQSSLDTEGAWGAQLTFSTTLSWDPEKPEGARLRMDPKLAGKAHVTVRVFVDLDSNGAWSPGDTPLEGVKLRRLGITNARGEAMAWLPSGSQIRLALDEEDLVDPRTWPTEPRVYVVRPGRLNMFSVPVAWRDLG